MIFKGSATALITPFSDNGIDRDSLRRLLNYQIENGTDAVVVLGTTGEPATMTDEEKTEVIKIAVETLKGKVPVIVGTGANSTAQAIKNSVKAEQLGADALLIVTPYYNKATQEGLVRHYTAIADSVNIPIILYNVPGRTGVNMLPKTVKTLCEHKNIRAVKEASGNMEQIQEVIRLVGGSAQVFSGDDSLTVATMALGGDGIISVASNVVPRFVSDMCKAFFDGDLKKAASMQLQMMPLIKVLFSEVNPIPVKKAAEFMGLCSGTLRLPLTEMSNDNAKELIKILKEFL